MLRSGCFGPLNSTLAPAFHLANVNRTSRWPGTPPPRIRPPSQVVQVQGCVGPGQRLVAAACASEGNETSPLFMHMFCTPWVCQQVEPMLWHPSTLSNQTCGSPPWTPLPPPTPRRQPAVTSGSARSTASKLDVDVDVQKNMHAHALINQLSASRSGSMCIAIESAIMINCNCKKNLATGRTLQTMCPMLVRGQVQLSVVTATGVE